MTFAEQQAKIARKKAKYEKLMNSHDMAERTAAMLMHSRAVDAENMLFDEQEKQSAGKKPSEKKAFGGFTGNLLEDFKNPKSNSIGFSGNLLADYNPESPAEAGFKSLADFTPGSPAITGSSGTMDNWLKMNRIGAAGNTILNGIDYFSKLGAIRQMQEPPKPINIPQTWLNKTLNTGAERNAILRNRISQERVADRLTDNQVSTAFKQKAGVDYLNQLSGIFDKERNYRTQMENQEAYMNANTRTRNVMQQNEYNYALNEFNNNRIGARQGALSSLLAKSSGVMRDTLDTKADMMRWALEAMKYDPTVSGDMLNVLKNLNKTNNG